MASNTSSAAARLCALACRQAVPRATTPRIMAATRTLAAARRQFTTSQSRWEDKAPTKDAPAAAPAAPAAAPKEPAAPAQAAAAPATPEDGMTLSDAQAEFKNVEILDITAKEHGYGSFDEYMERHAVEAGPATPRAERDFDRWITQLEEVKVDKNSWWHDPDDPEMDCEEVEDFDEDDMTEMAHAKLEEIKEMRQYARRAVYELPLLSKLAKPFEPPTDKQVLRWRYTTYFGESHPAESKVVVQFAPSDLGLTAVQTAKLKKLAGPRYNPQTELVRMSFEGFGHAAQNKRHLADVVSRLIAAAKDKTDTFEDVPLDTRHAPAKPRARFPKEWLMTEERRRQLDEGRQSLVLDEVRRVQAGAVVDGKQAIEAHHLQRMRDDEDRAALLQEQAAVAAPAKSSARSRRA